MADLIDTHPALVAADVANMQAGAEESLIERAGNFTGSALLSGFASIYNTAAAYTGNEQFDVAKWLDANDQHMGAYYAANKDLVDTTGFIATSLVPGGLALKGLTLAKAGVFGGPFKRAFGYLSSHQNDSLKASLVELAQEGGTVFNLINKNKLAAMTWGLGDQILSVAAFETAVAVTMKQSPLLEKDSWSTVGKHILLTSLAFGGIGGGLEALAIGSILKKGGKTIQDTLNEYQTLRNVEGDLPGGDKAYSILASMLELPTVGRNIQFTYRLAGKENALELPTKEALERAFVGTRKRAWTDFDKEINKLAESDPELGQAFSGFVKKMVDDGLQRNVPEEYLIERLQDHLLSIGKVNRVTEAAAKGTDDIFYVAETIPMERLGKITNFNQFLNTVTSRAPTGADVSRFPYRFVGDMDSAKIGIVPTASQLVEKGIGGLPRFPSIQDAWQGGMDAIVLANGTVRINDKSKLFKKVVDPTTAARSYFNVRTGAFSDTAFPTVADIATAARPLALTSADLVVAGGKEWKQVLLHDFKLDDMDTLATSARYAWAEQISVIPRKISDSDVPLLERIFQDGAEKWKETVLKSADGSERKVGDIADFGEWLKQQKLSILEGFFARTPKGADVTELATKLNVEADWIERGIARNFTATEDLGPGFSIPLKDSLTPQNLQIQWDFTKAVEVSKNLTGQKGPNPKMMVQTLPDGAGNIIYGELGWQYRVTLGNTGRENAFAAVMGADDAAKFVELNPEVATKVADQQGAGAGLIKFSNADYGDPLRLWSQYTGQLVSLMGKAAANTTLSTLQPLMLKIKDLPEAAGELGVLVTALRRTPEKFMFDSANNKRLINIEAAVKDKNLGVWILDTEKAAALEKSGRRVHFDIASEDVAEFMRLSSEANSARIAKMKVLMTSRGFNYNYDPRVVYAPPVDTARYPFFAFVRGKDGFLGGSSDVSMITARTEQELQKQVAKVPTDQYDVYFKQNTEDYFKVKGQYDYALTLKEPTVDAALQKRGVLGDFFPETRAENVLDDFINWHQRQEVSVVRRAVETKYAQTFTELRGIGRQFEEVGSSKFSAGLKKFKGQQINPFEDYLKTALDISKRSEYTLLHDANEFAEALGKKAYEVFGVNREKAMKGTISWQEANTLSEKYGIKGPYTGFDEYFTANAPEHRNLVKEFVGKANMFLVNLTLRLDMANSLVNIISTPILLSTEMASIRSLVANDSALAGKLNELRSIAVPGSPEIRIPSTTKLIFNAVKNFWSADKEALIGRYKDIGAIKDMLSQYHEMIEHFSYKPYEKLSKLTEWGNKGVEIGAKISRNEWAEQFTRFVSADVMRQLTDDIVVAGKMSAAEQNAYISIFTNRVQGNYLASQRPIAFQGVLGSAISLFQTYQFNLLQQLFRHVENRDTRAIATLAGMQGGIYGLHGIPFFEAINTHLIGNSDLNPKHHDVASFIPDLSKTLLETKRWGDWMMYGTASAFPVWGSNSPALYTRGDINPRHISIIPITPADVPAVDGSIRFVKNLYDMGKKAVSGADLSSVFLEGLEHNGLSRPLAGIAQVFQGYATTSKGSLISAANDFSVIATAGRIAGAKPMDESLALNSLFRVNAYKAADQARIENLGEVVKTKLRNGKVPTDEELQDFQRKYAEAGGRVENYARTLQKWSRDANVSVVNQMVQKHRSSYSQRMQEIMGGTTLPDFRSKALPPTEPQEE